MLSFKAFYCISTTRIKSDNEIFHLQPCKSINTIPLNYSQTDTYIKLMKSMYDYCQNYSYDFDSIKKDLPFSIQSNY